MESIAITQGPWNAPTICDNVSDALIMNRLNTMYCRVHYSKDNLTEAVSIRCMTFGTMINGFWIWHHIAVIIPVTVYFHKFVNWFVLYLFRHNDAELVTHIHTANHYARLIPKWQRDSNMFFCNTFLDWYSVSRV